MAFLYSFASSSKGNCTYVGSKQNGILIDAGIGIRQFVSHTKELGIQPGAVKGIFITHEHTDHVKGLARIQKQLNVPVYASKGTLVAMLEKGQVGPDIHLEVISDKPAEICDMKLTAFRTSHDSSESQCYHIETDDHKRVSICTDLGYVTEDIHTYLTQSDLVFLESNYDERMLQAGRYPYFLKRRIAGGKGHLSNSDCAEEIAKLYQAGIEKFVLGHLSEENNHPDVAEANIHERMLRDGAKAGADYLLSVAPVRNCGAVIEV